MPEPTPRPGAYDLYWTFASERQQIFERRLTGDVPPWTENPVLRTFKFCNVFRAADRVSQFLIRNVAYWPDSADDDRLFEIVAFRLFSNIDTWLDVRRQLGGAVRIKHLTTGELSKALAHTKRRNGKLYTGAFILCANDAYGRDSKHENHVALLRDMFVANRLALDLMRARTLATVYEVLHSYPLIGDFMAYQIAIDLNYSSLLNFSENDFTQAGPGALRGMKKIFEDFGGLSPADLILWMVQRQDDEFKRLRLPFNGLWGRPLHAIDCQGLFCETDRYCREVAPHLPSARKRIKARFRATEAPIEFFLPPKWDLNGRIGSTSGLPKKSQKLF